MGWFGWFSSPRYQDHISINRWTQALKPMVPSRIEVAVMPPHIHRRQPKPGHIPKVLILRSFYIQFSAEDLRMIFVPTPRQLP
jgi:hypothetical protein